MPKAWFDGNWESLKDLNSIVSVASTSDRALFDLLQQVGASVGASTTEIHACVRSVSIHVDAFVARLAIAHIILSIRLFIDM